MGQLYRSFNQQCFCRLADVFHWPFSVIFFIGICMIQGEKAERDREQILLDQKQHWEVHPFFQLQLVQSSYAVCHPLKTETWDMSKRQVKATRSFTINLGAFVYLGNYLLWANAVDAQTNVFFGNVYPGHTWGSWQHLL